MAPVVAGAAEPPAPEPLVAALLDPAAYDHPVEAVELIETHISWVFLTGSFAYKVKKPVDLGFVNFSTAERRQACCLEEVRLNRRLAPELYLGVRTIRGPVERAHLDGEGRAIESAVQMRQFQQHDLLPQVLQRGALTPAVIERLASDLARFHSQAARAEAHEPWGRFAAVLDPALANFRTLAQVNRLPIDGAELERATRERLEPLRSLVERRQAAGCIREGHGDLHLGNMVLWGDRILVFDCLEFSPSLRWIDPISDLAFLLMDLRQRGEATLALRLLNRWLDQCGDYGALPLLPWYLAYRALVRAKVTALRLSQSPCDPHEARQFEAELERYLQQARQALSPVSGTLLITHGIAGSGKSHAAARLVEQGWIQLRSDVERRRLVGRWGVAGPGCAARAGSDPPPVEAGLYEPAVSDRLYGQVLPAAAEAALAAGLAVVVDATFLRRDQRQAFQALAARCGAGFGILAASAPWPVIEARIARRRAEGGDPSEADGAVARRQLEQIEPLSPDECQWVVQAGDPRLAPPMPRLPIPDLPVC